MIYLDNAATSWPKPESVYDAVSDSIRRSGNPGRSNSEKARATAADINDARAALASLFHISDPTRIVFALNATDAINLALQGMLKPGDHVITSQMEHNAVTRPLAYLEDAGVSVTKVKTDPVKGVSLDGIREAIRPETRLIAMTHGSNVTGTLNPIEEIGEICHESGIPFFVDASQTAGAFPIDMEAAGIDVLVFTGHKSLMGPQGTGGMCVVPDLDIRPLISGGTGFLSYEPAQPESWPAHLEAGTPNGHGIAGLKAAVEYILARGPEKIHRREMELTKRFLKDV